MDDVIQGLRAVFGRVVRRIDAVAAAAPFGVASDERILRAADLVAVAHSKMARAGGSACPT